MHTRFWGLNLKERGSLQDLDVHGKIILKYLQWRGSGGMDWIDLDQDMKKLRAVVNAVMKLRVPKNARYFLAS